MKKTLTLLSFAGLVAAGGAFAQSDAAPMSGADAVLAEMDLHVAEIASDALSAHLDDTHKTVLKSLAHQHAVAANCDGFSLDEERNTAELAYIFDFLGTIDDEDKRQQAILTTMMGYATYLGGQHAIAAYDYGAFCRHAAEEQAGEGATDHVILKSSQ